MLAFIGFVVLLVLSVAALCTAVFLVAFNTLIGMFFGDLHNRVAVILFSVVGVALLYTACHYAPFTINWVG